MPIHFACSKCGKALFAQDRYGGRGVACPDCGTLNTIPSPPAPEKPVAQLIDMETAGKESSAPTELTPEPAATKSVPADPDATRRCPVCAETIKVAARKCRFCNAIFDPELRVQENQFATDLTAQAEKSANAWRLASILASGFTTSWLLYLTLASFGEMPIVNSVFDIVLVFGLMWNARQMRRGPHQVFLAAAIAIVLCMPLNVMMGLPLNQAEMIKLLKKNNPQISEDDIAMSMNASLCIFFLMVGVVFSIPLWVAAVKVRALQRMRRKK